MPRTAAPSRQHARHAPTRDTRAPSSPKSPISFHRSTDDGKALLRSTSSACGATTLDANSRTFSRNSASASALSPGPAASNEDSCRLLLLEPAA